MENLFTDKTVINIFKQIQYDLLDLQTNSGEDEISDLINKIPSDILNDKDNLMVVCRLFSYYARDNLHQNVGNAVKLFYKIIELLKIHLKDESSFFWGIFGSLLFFKLWMYEEGLITIEEIINATRQPNIERSNDTIEYFLPEIIEKEPEIFGNEIKSKLDPSKYSKEHLTEHKELRKKYFEWIKNSNDFKDPFYREIEKDPLRYSIKTDDIDSFQRLLSNTNINVDSTVTESIIENIGKDLKNAPLISYAIEFGSIKIIKYLIMNNAKLNPRDVFRSIYQKNYEIIHIVESNIPEFFNEWSFLCAISCWNEEIIEYANNNYHLKFFDYENDNFDEDDETKIRCMIQNTFFASNFIFLDSYLLPFLRKHQKYVEKKICNMIDFSFADYSCYFLKELLKYPEIDINYTHFSTNNVNLLVTAIKERNENAVELLLKMPNININSFDDHMFTPFQFVCVYQLNLRTVKLFCNDPSFKINEQGKLEEVQICVIRKSTYILDYLLCNFPELVDSLYHLYTYCLNENILLCLKIMLKYNLMKSSKDEIINDFKTIVYEYDDDTSIIDEFIEVLDQFQ